MTTQGIVSLLSSQGAPIDIYSIVIDVWNAFTGLHLGTPRGVTICSVNSSAPLAFAPSKLHANYCSNDLVTYLTSTSVLLQNVSPPSRLVVTYAYRNFIFVGLIGSAVGIGLTRLILTYWNRKIKIEKIQAIQQSLSELAAQVAHDIRSPLSAIKVIEHDLAELPEEKRVLLRTATQRIHDIANALLSKHRAHFYQRRISSFESHPEPFSVELLSTLIESLIAEKKAQHRQVKNVRIEALLDGAYAAFGNIQPNKFLSVLSNLLNNAIEAIQDKGTISVALVPVENFVEIRIIDTGKGIPAHVISSLGQQGFSYEKSSGTGLGLFDAIKAINSWGGSLRIFSEVGVGTTVVIRLHQSDAPTYFAKSIQLKSAAHVIIIDDDKSIHQMWDVRFQTAKITSRPTLVHHYDELSLRKWIDSNPIDPYRLFLFDFELIGSQKNGLELIRELHLESESILVTSRFDEKKLRETCEQLGVRLIPQYYARLIPIEYRNRS